MKDGIENMICSACLGHMWLPYLIDREDGSKPYFEMRSCNQCNPKGEHGVGVTLYEKSKGGIGTSWYAERSK